MANYRTDFIIPPDRYICVQLPSHLPEGKATITVTVHEPTAHEPGPLSESESAAECDIDHQDIEWWEEFEEGGERAESA